MTLHGAAVVASIIRGLSFNGTCGALVRFLSPADLDPASRERVSDDPRVVRLPDSCNAIRMESLSAGDDAFDRLCDVIRGAWLGYAERTSEAPGAFLLDGEGLWLVDRETENLEQRYQNVLRGTPGRLSGSPVARRGGPLEGRVIVLCPADDPLVVATAAALADRGPVLVLAATDTALARDAAERINTGAGQAVAWSAVYDPATTPARVATRFGGVDELVVFGNESSGLPAFNMLSNAARRFMDLHNAAALIPVLDARPCYTDIIRVLPATAGTHAPATGAEPTLQERAARLIPQRIKTAEIRYRTPSESSPAFDRAVSGQDLAVAVAYTIEQKFETGQSIGVTGGAYIGQ